MGIVIKFGCSFELGPKVYVVAKENTMKVLSVSAGLTGYVFSTSHPLSRKNWAGLRAHRLKERTAGSEIRA